MKWWKMLRLNRRTNFRCLKNLTKSSKTSNRILKKKCSQESWRTSSKMMFNWINLRKNIESIDEKNHDKEFFQLFRCSAETLFQKNQKRRKSDENFEFKNKKNENVKENRGFKIRSKILRCRNLKNDCFFNRKTCQSFIKQWDRNMYNDARNFESMWFRYEKRFEISRHQCHKEQSFFRKNVRKRESLFRRNYRANFHFCYQE